MVTRIVFNQKFVALFIPSILSLGFKLQLRKALSVIQTTHRKCRHFSLLSMIQFVCIYVAMFNVVQDLEAV